MSWRPDSCTRASACVLLPRFLPSLCIAGSVRPVCSFPVPHASGLRADGVAPRPVRCRGLCAANATRWLAAFVVAGFAAGGALLASDAWQHARQSSLRLAFDDLARARARRGRSGRSQSSRKIRRRLRSSRACCEATRRRRRGRVAEPRRRSHSRARRRRSTAARHGGRRHRHGGGLSRVGARAARWASGAPAGACGCRSNLHRPSRYLDEGVPDAERALQMRGTSLVGTTKSGALVEVLAARRLDRRADGGRSRGRAARHRRRRRPVERALRGDRHGHRHRRPRRPGRGCAAAAAGGRHVPRHRDFGRQHRDSRRPDDRRVPAGRPARTNGDAGVDRRAGRVRMPGRWRRVGRSRDAHGGRLLRRPRGRSAQPAAQRARVRRRVPRWLRSRCRSSIRRSS